MGPPAVEARWPEQSSDGSLAHVAREQVTPDGAILNTSCHVTPDGVLVVEAHLEPPMPMERGELPSIESLVSLRSVQGGEFLESDGGDNLYVKQNDEDQGASAQQQFTIRWVGRRTCIYMPALVPDLYLLHGLPCHAV